MSLDAAQRRAVLSHPAGWIALGFGTGLSPVAPGTVGSVAAALLWLPLREIGPVGLLLTIIVATAIGVWASNVVIARLQIDDPGSIVWDEFVGQWITLLPLLIWPAHDGWIVAGFLLFRLFDIWKPGPIRWADDHIKDGLGVMADDVLAGVLAALAFAGLLAFLS
ncbi:MAG: phosphatidylglycerophosphatase A [Dokdonella sp.]